MLEAAEAWLKVLFPLQCVAEYWALFRPEFFFCDLRKDKRKVLARIAVS